MSGITIRDLVKDFGGVRVLHDISFDCQVGQITGLIGPNGSGKTSVMRLLTALSASGGGTAHFAGRRYADLDNPGREVGVLLDATAHHPGRSVYETIRIAGMLMEVSKDRVHEVIATVGLSSVRRRRFGALSLGMKQRVGLAIAILGRPRFLILDEPVNGLDVESIQWLRQLLVTFCRESAGTVLMSSHLLQELESYVDHVVMINQGRVVLDDTLVALKGASICDVVADEPERLASVLRDQAITWRVTRGNCLTVDADSRTVAQLALENRVLITELTPGGTRSLERRYLRAATGEFATGDPVGAVR